MSPVTVADPASEARAELTAIGGIGSVVAEAIVEFFKEEHNEEMLDALLQEYAQFVETPGPTRRWPARRSSSRPRSR